MPEAESSQRALASAAAPSSAPPPSVRLPARTPDFTEDDFLEPVEQYEASTEEMKASNEKLQSINEELTTVNLALKEKADELARANSDLQNLMASTAIATVFLDLQLTIRRYTPSAVPLFHLIPSDLGRPLANLKPTLDYPEISVDCEQVLRTLVPTEREVSDGTRWFQARLQPYRTLEDHIAGVVLTFVDVSEAKIASQIVASDLEATARLAAVADRLTQEEDVQALLDTILEAALALTRAEAGTLQLFDPERQALRMLSHRGFPAEVTERFAEIGAASASTCGQALHEKRRVHLRFEASTPDSCGTARWHREVAGLLSGQSTPLVTRGGRILGMLSTHWRQVHEPGERELRFFDLLVRHAADAIERKQSDDLLHQQMDELQRFHAATVGREERMVELKLEINALLARLGEAPRYAPLGAEEKA